MDERENTEQGTHTPRDVRLLRLIFASQGVTSYEDHVPLQLLDFAYRYTTDILQDAMIYNDYAHPQQTNAGNMGSGHDHNHDDDDDSKNHQLLNNEDIRLAIAARTSYQFKPVPPKKMLMELAAERNEKPLPAVMPMWGGQVAPRKILFDCQRLHWGAWRQEKEEMSLSICNFI